jgi:hypothetical protein
MRIFSAIVRSWIAGLPAAGRRHEERAEVTVSANAVAGHGDDGFDDDEE